MELHWTHNDNFHDRSYTLRAEMCYSFGNFEGMFESMVQEGRELNEVRMCVFRAFISRRKSEQEMYYLHISVLGAQKMKCWFYDLESARQMAEKVLINFVNNLHRVKFTVNQEPLKLRPEDERTF